MSRDRDEGGRAGRAPSSLQSLKCVAFGQVGATEVQQRDGGLVLDLQDRSERARVPRQGAAALTAAEQAGSDGEGPGTGRVVDESSTLHGTDDENTRRARDRPRPGWQRH